MTITIGLVDDHTLVRRTLSTFFSACADVSVSWDVSSGREAFLAYRDRPVDVVVTDFVMDNRDGLELAELLLRLDHDARVVMLTFYDEPAFVHHVLDLGVRGYVSKKAVPEVLLDAILRVSRGELYVDESIALDRSTPAASLTTRQYQVLMGIARGRNNHEIARDLCISVKTVDTHRLHAMKKLGLRSNIDVIRFAMRTGLIRA